MRWSLKCVVGITGSAIGGIVAAGAFAAGLLDQLSIFEKASDAFEVWWVVGGCVLGLIGGIGLGAASFCLGGEGSA